MQSDSTVRPQRGRAVGEYRVIDGPRLLAALCVLVGLLAFAPAAQAERVFDPSLSLIGGCKAETLDPVEDPGCPTTTPPSSAHPPSVFAKPTAVATDLHGDIFVASLGNNPNGSEGRVDIFGPTGVFITEVKPNLGSMALAIDKKGVLYVVGEKAGSNNQLLRYTPCLPYEPGAGKINYCEPPVLVAESASLYIGLAINADNDHLFANFGGTAYEFGSAEESNALIRKTVAAGAAGGVGMAVDASRERLYVGSEDGFVREIDIFDLTQVEGSPPEDHYKKVGTIGDASIPAEAGGDIGSLLSVAVDEETGHIYVFDTENSHLYEFDEAGTYLATIGFKFQSEFGSEIGVDNGPSSPNQGYLFVPSHKSAPGHSFAFEESIVKVPKVSSVSAANVSETEAELVAQINPGNLETTYTIEYTTEESFEAEGFAGAILAEEGTLPPGNGDVEVSALAAGLQPETGYRFRVSAENEKGAATPEVVVSFATYPSTPLGACANDLLRTGPSALLPDCRAYELVTPPDTNGRAPLGVVRDINTFTTRQVSPGGDRLPFTVDGGSLPGYGGGTGSFHGDPYLATRTAGGWSTAYVGPAGTEVAQSIAGSSSPDQGYSFWVAEGSGTAVLGGARTSYTRFPDGHSELIGQGSLGAVDPRAIGQLISEGGGHILFTSGGDSPAVQLEPDAAPSGTAAIYDRVPNPESGERETKVVSLKPGEIPFGAGEGATYMGSSLDGEGVVFKVGTTLYLRYQDAESFAIGTGLTYAGMAEGGARIFYLQGGNLKAFDANTEAVVDFSASGNVTPVFIAQGGQAAYFTSPSVLAGANPAGELPQAGAQNLYLSEEGQLGFVGTVTDRDVEGSFLEGGETVDGLGLWVRAANPLGGWPGRFGAVPARATPDGNVLLFKSRAQLTDYDSDGKAEIYRYDSGAEELQCLSCNPTGAPPSTDATLQTERRDGNIALFLYQAWLENLRADGKRAFFESSEPLVAGDSDGHLDVYEWEAQGVGSCQRPQGCVQLISSPRSQRDEYIWAVSQSGDDVFFFSSELLVGADADSTPSIYDARVGGGFAEAPPPQCEGEGCRPRQQQAPALPTILTPVLSPGENFKPRCAKGKRQVKRAGKVRCAKRKSHKRQANTQRAGTNKKGGRR